MPSLINNTALNNLLARSAAPDHQMQQPHDSNECGAYALCAALGALGVFEQASIVPLRYLGATVQVNTGVDDFATVVGRIFELTGILNPTPPIDMLPPGEGGGYNSPAAMARIATDFHRNVTINATQNALCVLGAAYPGERGRCEAEIGTANVVAGAVAYAAPGLAEVQLVCVQTTVPSLHWIVRGSPTLGNALYYDPGTGSINDDLGDPDPVTGAYGSGDYTFTGLWMTLG